MPSNLKSAKSFRITDQPERIRVWQCIGCGKIDASKPCIGVCEDRAQEMVYAADCDALAAEAAQLRAVVLRVAGVTPREGAWKQGWEALNVSAEKALAATRSGVAGRKP